MKLSWKKVTLKEKAKIASDTILLRFSGDKLTKHIPGQFYLLKVTDKSGLEVSREYSLSNSPNTENIIELGIQKIPNGVVSSVLNEITLGTKIFVKGPMGKYFNWDYEHKGPVVFISGGSGIVPFMSFLRSTPKNKLILISSFKTFEQIPYYDELKSAEKDNLSLDVFITLTQNTDANWEGHEGRINEELLSTKLEKINKNESIYYVCGRSSFVESISEMLISLKIDPAKIQRERFG